MLNRTQQEILDYLVDQRKKLADSVREWREEGVPQGRSMDALEGQLNAVDHIWNYFGRLWVG